MGISVTPLPTPSPAAASSGPASSSGEFFYVYKDADYSLNHFTPSGYMGDIYDVKVNEISKTSPYSGGSCIKVTYEPAGNNDWAGVYWQQPPNNWGTSDLKGQGYDLSKYKKLTFYARAEKDCIVKFLVGGAGGADHPYGDSLEYERVMRVELTDTWQMFSFSLEDGNLSHIISGFGFAADTSYNPDGAVFYLDEIRYEN